MTKKSQVKLNLDQATLLAVLQVALDGAIAQRDAAMAHHDEVADAFTVRIPQGAANPGDISRMLAVKEISESIEKYLKSADASIDKIIKIARLLADTMLRMNEEEMAELTEEEKAALRDEIQQMVSENAQEDK